MSKKESLPTLEASNVVDLSESKDSPNEFDLSVLKSDIENQEKEVKEAIQQDLINKANLQKDTEIIPVNAENNADFAESLSGLLEFAFSFLNKKLERVEVSQFDKQFINDFIEKLLKLIPNDQMSKIKNFIGAGNKSNSAKNIFKIFAFLSFISQELYKRFDEYQAFKKLQKVESANKLTGAS